MCTRREEDSWIIQAFVDMLDPGEMVHTRDRDGNPVLVQYGYINRDVLEIQVLCSEEHDFKIKERGTREYDPNLARKP